MVLVTLAAEMVPQVAHRHVHASNWSNLEAAWRPSGMVDLEKRARQVFERWGGGDQSSGGRLTKGQAKNALISLLGYRVSKSELERMCGADGISWEDFIRRVRERHADTDQDEEARQAFKALDRSCNGFLTLSDVKASFREAVPHISSTVVEQVFFEMDSDRDGRMSYHKFRTMWHAAS